MAYPTTKYSKTATRTVQSAEEEKKLGAGWYDSPGDVPGVNKDANGFAASAPFDSTPLPDTNIEPPLGTGHKYHDRIVWQAQNYGIKVDKRWSDETLLRKIAELGPLPKDGIEEANKAVPDDQELDYDPTLSAQDREVEKKADEKLAAEKPDTPKQEAPKPVASAKQPEAAKP